jgi:hypothetical protein
MTFVMRGLIIRQGNQQFSIWPMLLPDSYIRRQEAMDVAIHREQYDSK